MLIYNEEWLGERLEEAKAFSQQMVEAGLPSNRSLENQLALLDGYACHKEPDDTITVLHSDFAPHSFTFVIYGKAKPGREMGPGHPTVKQYPQLEKYAKWFNGGLIYHGRHDNGGDGGSPTFSVNLCGGTGWSVHT